MRSIIAGLLLSCGSAAFASTIYPPLPPITDGQNVGYVTHGDTEGVLWTAGWFSDGANQSVWAVKFGAPISSYSLTIDYGFAGTQGGASGNFYPLNGGTLNYQWLSKSVLQVYGTAPGAETMNIFLGADPGTISFQTLTSANAPEPTSAVLCALGVLVMFQKIAKWRTALPGRD